MKVPPRNLSVRYICPAGICTLDAKTQLPLNHQRRSLLPKRKHLGPGTKDTRRESKAYRRFNHYKVSIHWRCARSAFPGSITRRGGPPRGVRDWSQSSPSRGFFSHAHWYMSVALLSPTPSMSVVVTVARFVSPS